MGLFDEVNKAVVNQQQQKNYGDILQQAGINIPNLWVQDVKGTLTIAGTVTDMQTAEKAVAALKAQPGVVNVFNLLEMEDLTSKNIKMKVITKSSNLNIRKGPGTDFEIIGKAAHESQVQLIKRMYNDWYFVRTEDGVEGFSSANYLQGV
ncbi:MAG: SH3 domain-containing protein [Daejeonella sp.]|uniref:SH3 domain-containing protein n=1 Tax=Daejeonella sp. TaxID=2805397 RepID=UPI003C74B7DE